MSGLVQTDLTSARELNFVTETPPGLFDFRSPNALGRESLSFGPEVLAHEVELVPNVTVRRMHRQLGWW